MSATRSSAKFEVSDEGSLPWSPGLGVGGSCNGEQLPSVIERQSGGRVRLRLWAGSREECLARQRGDASGSAGRRESADERLRIDFPDRYQLARGQGADFGQPSLRPPTLIRGKNVPPTDDSPRAKLQDEAKGALTVARGTTR